MSESIFTVVDAQCLSRRTAFTGSDARCEAGTIALRVTLDEAHPAVLENYSGLNPDEPSAVLEPVTLGLCWGWAWWG